MNEIFNFILMFCYFCHISMCYSSSTSKQLRLCREKQRIIGTDKSDLYKLVDVKYGQKVMLDCYYCNEKDDKTPKVWYHQDQFLSSKETEVNLDVKSSNLTLNRVYLTPDHTLVIQNISQNDTGVYYCHGVNGELKKNKYNFFLDAVINSTSSPLIGNLTKWDKYQQTKFIPLNTLLRTSQEGEFVYLRKDYGVKLHVFSEWESWGPCVACNRPQNQGEHRRLGKCRLRAVLYNKDNNTFPGSKTLTGKLLRMVSELSCYSELIAYMLPNISTITRNIPEFVHVENCVGTCSSRQYNATTYEEEYKKRKHHKLFIELVKGDSVTIVCPEATVESVVTWHKNKEMISSEIGQDHEKSFQESHIIIDSFGSLILNSVTRKEEGNYTCFIDNIKMQEIKVLIYSQSRLFSKEKLRHMIYLSYIFIISFICYCGQVIIACKKRHNFLGYSKRH